MKYGFSRFASCGSFIERAISSRMARMRTSSWARIGRAATKQHSSIAIRILTCLPQTARAESECHGAGAGGGHLILGDAADFLDVEFAVEEMGVDPGASAFEEAAVNGGAGGVAGGARHFLAGAEGAEIIDAAHGVGAVELDVVGVVLDAFEDAIAIGVPAAGDPGELDGLFDFGPHGAEPIHVAGEQPIEVGVHDLPHLAIGGGVAPALRGVVGEVLAEADAAGVVEIEAEADGAQGAGEGGEEVGGGGFVIPNVGTTAVAAAGMIVNAFEAVEFAIGGAEARGGDESGEIGAGGLLDDGGESGLAEGGGEAAGDRKSVVEG